MLKIALGQLLVEGGEPDRNFERALELIEKAKSENSDIIVLPECLDYGWTHPSSINQAHPIPGKYSNILTEAAKKFKIHICGGITEKSDDGKNYNTALLIDDNGQILLKYRKINVLDEAKEFYSVGSKLEVVNTKFGKVGVNICSDNYKDSIDIGIVLCRMGAQLILSPSSWTVDHSVTEQDDPYKLKWANQLLKLSDVFNITFVSTTSVGYIVGGPYEGKKMVGCSIATDKGKLIAQGEFNEFASDIKYIEVELVGSNLKGTLIGPKIYNEGFLEWKK